MKQFNTFKSDLFWGSSMESEIDRRQVMQCLKQRKVSNQLNF